MSILSRNILQYILLIKLCYGLRSFNYTKIGLQAKCLLKHIKGYRNAAVWYFVL
jgi:hypothetical protein